MDLELSRAESELQAEEAALHTELNRLAHVSSELAGRLSALQQQAAQAGDAAIARRAQVSPPVIDPNATFARARAAREAAVQARREANAAAHAQVTQLKAHLQKMASQLLADEKAIRSAQSAPPPVDVPVPASPPKKPVRASTRVKMQAAVDFTSDNNFYAGFSANISGGGLFVATVNLLPLGTEVDLSFTLPSGVRIETKGQVAWVREVNDKLPDAFPGMGVQFVGLAPGLQTAINQFLAQRDPLFFADAD